MQLQFCTSVCNMYFSCCSFKEAALFLVACDILKIPYNIFIWKLHGSCAWFNFRYFLGQSTLQNMYFWNLQGSFCKIQYNNIILQIYFNIYLYQFYKKAPGCQICTFFFSYYTNQNYCIFRNNYFKNYISIFTAANVAIHIMHVEHTVHFVHVVHGVSLYVRVDWLGLCEYVRNVRVQVRGRERLRDLFFQRIFLIKLNCEMFFKIGKIIIQRARDRREMRPLQKFIFFIIFLGIQGFLYFYFLQSCQR
eukprot:TRINITY_DN27742_c0_g2_i3.p3 TRINITY_DN27742_c0_g2~~TRINITY_DN27742_c0_g2_i3.p3  ORF type:complete len:249 (+),score=-9.21 TRINITY_DN27742_c0_g2_i3:520-1266(+)